MLGRVIRMTKNFFTDPAIRFYYLKKLGLTRIVSDEKFLQKEFALTMGYPLHLRSPKTFNEKIQWIKLYDRNPVYTELVDKYEVRKHIVAKYGESFLIPLVGGPWDSFDEIDFAKLPEQFVLKCTHDSGGLVICTDKSRLDLSAAKAKIEASLKENFFWVHREWPYKNVKPRIIAEAYMDDENAAEGLTDYKFFCFGGEPKLLYISRGLSDHSTASISFYDLDGNRMPFRRSDYRPIDGELVLPANFDEMKTIAAELAKTVGCAFVRIDLYSIRGRIYFSEVTFSPCAGMLPFEPTEWDRKLGDWIDLPTDGRA